MLVIKIQSAGETHSIVGFLGRRLALLGHINSGKYELASNVSGS